MASFDRARLLIHNEGDGALLLIHEVEQPSHLLLWEIEILDFIYCALAVGQPLQSGLVKGSTLSKFVSSGSQTVFSSGLEARTRTGMVVDNGYPVVGSVTGGHC